MKIARTLVLVLAILASAFLTNAANSNALLEWVTLVVLPMVFLYWSSGSFHPFDRFAQLYTNWMIDG